MKRRKLIALLASTPVTWPAVAFAQQTDRLPRIGVTLAGTPPNAFAEALRRGLAERGWVDGETLLIEERYAEGRNERYPGFIAEFVDLAVDAIVTGGGERAARAALELTGAIPVVVPVMGDPVASGLVGSLARPGGNLTGQSMQVSESSAKRVDLLRQLKPDIERVAILQDQNSPHWSFSTPIVEAAARAAELKPQVFPAKRVEEFEPAFAAIGASRADALIVLSSSFYYAHRRSLVDLAARYRLVSSYEHRSFVKAGGLMSYGPNLAAMYRSAAGYVDRVLKGEKPGDLPIAQPTVFDLAINLRTANALGLTLPPMILLQATEVIE